MTSKGHKLLLADDSVTIRHVVEATFAGEAIEVVTVSDGAAAIARLEAEPPDVVLADIGMPGQDGYAVALHVRRTPALAHIPVILLTGAFDPVDYARAREAGCAGVAGQAVRSADARGARAAAARVRIGARRGGCRLAAR